MIRVLKFVRTLPRDPAGDPAGDPVARQLTRSGTGASANYHSACRARSRAEFISRLRVALDEVDESCHWLLVIRGSELAAGPELEWLLQESAELRAIISKSVSTARANQRAAQD